MRFDVTDIDLRILTRAIIAYAEPKGLGKEEYSFKKMKNVLVDSISDEDLEFEILAFESLVEGSYRLFDYYQGKPIKLDLFKKENGRIIASSSGYDTRNGKYRFLEVLLNFFSQDEIKIVQKSYGFMEDYDFPENKNRSKKDLVVFKTMIQNSIKKHNKYGRFWIINTTENLYKSPFEKLLNV